MGEEGEMGEKTLAYYLGLPYTTKVSFNGEVCDAWIEELSHCRWGTPP
jgi:hypothetical protein